MSSQYTEIVRHAHRLGVQDGTLATLINAMADEANTLVGRQLELRRRYVNGLYEMSDSPELVPLSYFSQSH